MKSGMSASARLYNWNILIKELDVSICDISLTLAFLLLTAIARGLKADSFGCVENWH